MTASPAAAAGKIDSATSAREALAGAPVYNQDDTDRYSSIRLVASPEPAVVFNSLAAQCVPAQCDSVVIDITDGGAEYRIAYPLDGPARTDAGTHTARLSFTCDGSAGGNLNTARDGVTSSPNVQGLATFEWHRRPPTPADHLLVASLIDHAVRTLAWQHAELRAKIAAAKADNLEIALKSSRRIGAAVGILMTVHKVTENQAFDILRLVSQRTHRKVRDVADDVWLTGWLEIPPGSPVGRPLPPAR